MIKFYGPKRRKKFDEEADWLPQKNKLFVLEQPIVQTEPQSEPQQEPKQEAKKPTDKEGLDQAYASADSLYRDAQGTLHVAGTRGGFLDSDWMENYKI